MSPFESALLCGVILAALANIGNRRAWLWLAAGVADYVFTSAWYAYGLPAHPFVTAMTDAAVCVAIYLVGNRYGGHKWELPLFSAFQFSVLVSFTKIAELASDYNYALFLELANWAALLVFIGTGTMRLADGLAEMGDAEHNRGGLHRLVSSLYAPARIDTWWWLRGWLPARAR